MTWLSLIGTFAASALVATMTWVAAYQLGRQAGSAEGYDRGVEQGRAEGWRAANRALLLAMQRYRFQFDDRAIIEWIGRN